LAATKNFMEHNKMNLTRRYCCLLSALMLVIAMSVGAHAQAAAPAAAQMPTSTAELKDTAAKAPTTDQLKAGDPSGAITGTVNDVPVADPKTGLTLGDVANQAGQDKVAINFTWTLICGFLVMFMQAGFAMVESGLCRVKNANHTYMMNFFVYGCALLAYWLIGFAIQMGGVGSSANLGGVYALNPEKTVHLFGKDWGIFGTSGMFLAGHTYDVGVSCFNQS
jgi:Amt family ammonium transporter